MDLRVFLQRSHSLPRPRVPNLDYRKELRVESYPKPTVGRDRIVFVGSMRHPTPRDNRGRLLGMAELGQPFSALQSSGAEIDFHRIWRFVRKPPLVEVVSEELPYFSACQPTKLTASDTRRVLALEYIEEHFSFEVDDTTLGLNYFDAHPSQGVLPSEWSKEVTRRFNHIAFTYVFRFGRSEIWKIGYTSAIDVRLRQVNQHIPTELLGVTWCFFTGCGWSSEQAAYEMEQELLARLQSYRTQGERVHCPEAAILTAWQEVGGKLTTLCGSRSAESAGPGTD